ncbi:uncharacterized protein LY89DRAFT_670921 [Mollisia scopiformis]|uniref:Uncharacterized protein n=1 Tax=Mollisia scopiformis TaxID=149040 RepID=A0A194X6M2_MOLSC|nr:uncharacterized protein LY89DRAFT_670921 [Mollisia scopiformis]KUJ15452.1 hypothetical protein LY89DRAFT_670921 [Mollisia scopiformis]
MSAHLRRLNRYTMHAPISKLSRHRLRQVHTHPYPQTQPEYPTPYHAQAHPLQISTAAMHVTPVEMVILMGALGILVALLCWIGWIIFTYVFQFVKDKIDDFNVGKRTRARVYRREQEIEDTPRKLGKAVNTVATAAKHLFEGLTRSGGWRDREGGERRGLLQEVEREARQYGYHEGTLYEDRTRYVDGDGTSESTGSAKTTVTHRDDCGGQQCGESGQPRKRSIEV